MAKQVCDIKSTQGIAAADSKEQTRSWSPKQMELRMENQNLNYDFTRSHLNFEIVDGEIKDIDKDSLLDDNIRENLKRRNIPHPEDSKSHVKKGEPEPEKMKRNIAARMILGGSTDRMNEIAFGNQIVNFEKGSDNSHIKRTKDIEKWALDEYAWLENMFGKGSVARFIVHLDEGWVHGHATVIPTAIIKKKERVSWRQVFGGSLDVSRPKWKNILDEHYNQVGKQWGLERGDPIALTGAQHRSTRDYNKFLNRENARLEKENVDLAGRFNVLASARNELQQEFDGLKQQHDQLSDEHAILVTEHTNLVERCEDARKSLVIMVNKAEQLAGEMGKHMKAMKSLTSMIQNKMTERNNTVQDFQRMHAQHDSGMISDDEYEAIAKRTNTIVDEFDIFIKGKADRLTDIGIQLIEKQSQLNQLHKDYDELIAQIDDAKKFKKENDGLMKRMASYLSNSMIERSLLDTAKRLNAIPEGEKVEGLSQLADVLKIFADGYPEKLKSAKAESYKLGYNTRNNEISLDIERLRNTLTNLGATAQQTQNANLSALIVWLEELARKHKSQLEVARTQGKAEGEKVGRKAIMKEISAASGRNWSEDKMPSPQTLGQWYKKYRNDSLRMEDFEKEHGSLSDISKKMDEHEDEMQIRNGKIKQLRGLIPTLDDAIDAIIGLFHNSSRDLSFSMEQAEYIWRILSMASTKEECNNMAHQLVAMARSEDPKRPSDAWVKDTLECVLEVAENINPLAAIFSLIPDTSPSVGGGSGNNDLPRKKDDDDDIRSRFNKIMSSKSKGQRR